MAELNNLRKENTLDITRKIGLFTVGTGMLSVLSLAGGVALHRPIELVGNILLTASAAFGMLCVTALLELIFHSIPEHPKKEKWQSDFPRVRAAKKLVDGFSDSQRRTYKALPNEEARINWLRSNAPELLSLLHSDDGASSTILVDAVFLTDLRDYFVAFGNTDDTSIVSDLLRDELPAISIDKANLRVSEEVARAANVWNSLSEKTQQDFRFRETSKQQEKLHDKLSETMPSFYRYYPLIYVTSIRTDIASVYSHTYGDEYAYKIMLDTKVATLMSLAKNSEEEWADLLTPSKFFKMFVPELPESEQR